MKHVLPTLLLLLPLPAQKMLLTDGSERVVAVLDIRDLVGRGAADVVASDPSTPPIRPPEADKELGRIAEFVRAFADPPLGNDVVLQPLADHFLVALGKPDRVAAADRLIAHVRKTAAMQFLVDLRILSMSQACFERELQPRLAPLTGEVNPAAPRVAVLSAADTKALLRAVAADATCGLLQAPQLVTRSMQHTTIAIGKQLAYVRDFEFEVAQAAFLANPIVDVLWDGQSVEALCAELPDGTVGITMEVLDQKVERPIRKITTTVPGTTKEVEIQLPRTTGCRGSQTAALPRDSTAVMAARKNDGTWLVTLLTASVVGKVESIKAR